MRLLQIAFYDVATSDYIKGWPNWDGAVPVIGDWVRLHFGDDNEEAVNYIVRGRVIDGLHPEIVKLVVEKVEKR